MDGKELRNYYQSLQTYSYSNMGEIYSAQVGHHILVRVGTYRTYSNMKQYEGGCKGGSRLWPGHYHV